MTTCFFLSTLAVAACGSLAEDEGQPSTLVTLRGTVTSDTGVLGDADVRVAMIWASGNDHVLAVDTDIKAEFPASFSLPIQFAPPDEFVVPMDDEPGAPSAAIAFLVAYKDANQNGRLDMLDEDAEHSVDQIVAVEPDHLVVFLKDAASAASAELIDVNGARPAAGFNLAQRSASWDLSWVPLSTQLSLEEDTSARAQQILCLSYGEAGGGGPVVIAPAGTLGPDGAFPSADDPRLSCSASGDSYNYSADTLLVDRPCYKEYETVVTQYSKQPGAEPVGWPCPAN